VEEIEPRIVPATPMNQTTTAALPAASATTSSNPAAQLATLLAQVTGQQVANALQQSILAATIQHELVNAVIATNPVSTADQLAFKHYLPGTLIARFGYVGVFQIDPQAALHLSTLYAGGDDSGVPVSPTPQVPLNLFPFPVALLANEGNTE